MNVSQIPPSFYSFKWKDTSLVTQGNTLVARRSISTLVEWFRLPFFLLAMYFPRNDVPVTMAMIIPSPQFIPRIGHVPLYILSLRLFRIGSPRPDLTVSLVPFHEVARPPPLALADFIYLAALSHSHCLHAHTLCTHLGRFAYIVRFAHTSASQHPKKQ